MSSSSLHLCLLGEGPSLAPSACSGKAHCVPEVPGDQTSHLGFNPWLMGAHLSQLWLPPPPRGRLRRGSCTASQRPSVERRASSPHSSKFAGTNLTFLLASSLPFLPLSLPCPKSNGQQVSGTLSFSRWWVRPGEKLIFSTQFSITFFNNDSRKPRWDDPNQYLSSLYLEKRRTSMKSLAAPWYVEGLGLGLHTFAGLRKKKQPKQSKYI